MAKYRFHTKEEWTISDVVKKTKINPISIIDIAQKHGLYGFEVGINIKLRHLGFEKWNKLNASSILVISPTLIWNMFIKWQVNKNEEIPISFLSAPEIRTPSEELKFTYYKNNMRIGVDSVKNNLQHKCTFEYFCNNALLNKKQLKMWINDLVL